MWLWLSFTLVGIVVCLSFSRVKIPVVAQVAVVGLVLWYGIALFFLPGSLAGWPRQADVSRLPVNTIILSFSVIEPSPTDKGAIYVWLVDYKERKRQLKKQLDPTSTYERDKTVGVPRAYEVPYSKQLHKDMEAAKARAQNKNFMALKKGEKALKKGRTGTDSQDDVKVVVISPAELLTKDTFE